MTLYKAFRTSVREQYRVLILGLICAALYAALVHAAVPAHGSTLVAYHHSTKSPGLTTLPSTVISMGEAFR